MILIDDLTDVTLAIENTDEDDEDDYDDEEEDLTDVTLVSDDGSLWQSLAFCSILWQSVAVCGSQ